MIERCSTEFNWSHREKQKKNGAEIISEESQNFFRTDERLMLPKTPNRVNTKQTIVFLGANSYSCKIKMILE